MNCYIENTNRASLDNFYRKKLLSQLSGLRGTTRMAKLTRSLALKSYSEKVDEYDYLFDVEGLSFKSANLETFAAAVTERQFVNRYIQELNELNDGKVLDLGGYHGFYSLIAGKRGFSVEVFEPDEHNFQNLSENIELNNFDIKSHQKAVWDENASVNMTSTANVKNTVGKGEVEVQAVKLDDFVDSDVALVKLDVEGAELKALRGMKEILKENRPVLLIELHKKGAKKPFQHNPREVKEFLREQEYQIEVLEERGKQELLVAKND